MHLLANTWCLHLSSFLYNSNPFEKDLNRSYCLVPNKLLFAHDSSAHKLGLISLPVRGDAPQFDEGRELREVKSYADLPCVDQYDCGRAIVKNISATRWGIVSDTYFKGHAFINCRFEECTFHCRIFHNYFVACQFNRCTFLDCEAPPGDGHRLAFNCSFDKCRVIHTTTNQITTQRFAAFTDVLIGRQTDPIKHLRNKKNIYTVVAPQP